MKKLISLTRIALCAVLAVTLSLVFVPSATQNVSADTGVIIGDVNGDGVVNAVDTLILRKHLAEFDCTYDETNSDTNCNGNISTTDLLNLKKFLADIITDFSQVFVGTNLDSIENLNAHPENLGIPGKAPYKYNNIANIYARNIWDMQKYDDKVMLGMGNYEDNTGKTSIYYYRNDLDTARLSGSSIGSEQISRFFTIENSAGENDLFATATDPTLWLTGDYYYYRNHTTWETHTSLTNNIHCYDMIRYDGKYFFGGPNYNGSDYLSDIAYIDEENINTSTSSTQVPMVVKDVKLSNGKTIDFTLNNFSMYRVYDMFVFGGELYAVEYATMPYTYVFLDEANKAKYGYDYVPEYVAKYNYKIDYSTFPTAYVDSRGVYKYNKDALDFEKVENSQSVLNVLINRGIVKGNEFVESEPICYIKREVGNKMVLVCNDIFTTTDLVNYNKVSLGTGYENYVVRDCVDINGKYYIIASEKQTDYTYKNILFSTTDFTSFKKVLYFNSNAFIRSIEYNDNAFYFGCGAYLNEKDLNGDFLSEAPNNENYLSAYYTDPFTNVTAIRVVNTNCGTVYRLKLFEE